MRTIITKCVLFKNMAVSRFFILIFRIQRALALLRQQKRHRKVQHWVADPDTTRSPCTGDSTPAPTAQRVLAERCVSHWLACTRPCARYRISFLITFIIVFAIIICRQHSKFNLTIIYIKNSAASLLVLLYILFQDEKHYSHGPFF